ncbi:MAG: 50S ribosomal protein L19 [Patescibacteria group bacterium]
MSEEQQTTDQPNVSATPVPTEPAAEAAPEVKTEEAATPATEAKTEAAAEELIAPVEAKLNLKPGMTIQVHQKIRETNTKGEEKERIQIFEGMILAYKHGKQDGATITVRKVSGGIGVEKIFPLNSPNVVKIVPIKQAEVRRAKLFYLRDWGKRLKEKLLK